MRDWDYALGHKGDTLIFREDLQRWQRLDELPVKPGKPIYLEGILLTQKYRFGLTNLITRDPQGKLRDEVFFCTDQDATPVQIVEWVVMRFSIETTFQEARGHLGMETQRQWSDLAIKRTTPVLLSLFSIVILLAMRLQQDDSIPVQPTAWYRKTEPTFSDCMLLVRRHLREARFFVNSTQKQEMVQSPCEILDLLCVLELPLVA